LQPDAKKSTVIGRTFGSLAFQLLTYQVTKFTRQSCRLVRLEGALVLLRIVCVILLFAAVSSASSFDPPHSKKTIDLGPTPSRSSTHGKVRCYFYSEFMVKEVDMGEKGAARLAIIPITNGASPKCISAQDKAEKVINPDSWTGYFKGVKNDLVFFDADDGVNGGMGFAVFDSHTGKKIFEDSALGALQFQDAPADQITFRYTRVLDSQCFITRDPEPCWEQIKKTISIENVSQPDCKPAYEESAQKLAKGRCRAKSSNNDPCIAKEIKLARDQTDAANTIIAYPVEVTLAPTPSIKPLPGDLRCWPGD